MFALNRLFNPSPTRHFALLDNQGICRALRQSSQAPSSSHWVEVHKPHPGWLEKPLPAGARKQAA